MAGNQNKGPDLEFVIDDERSYTEFIGRLRDLLANHNDGQPVYILDGKRPQLPMQTDAQPNRWLDIKLIVRDENMGSTTTTTLVIRDDNVYIKGFKNKDGDWFELIGDKERSAKMLPTGTYSPLFTVDWDVDYKTILNTTSDKAMDIVESLRLNRSFMQKAVVLLSEYKLKDDFEKEKRTREALVTLIVMVCESARMNPIHMYCANLWDYKWFGPNMKMRGYFRNWGKISQDLQKLQETKIWTPNKDLTDIKLNRELGISKAEYTPEYALDVVYLVINSNGDRGVELLNVWTSFPVALVTVTDGKHRQIIYNYMHKEGGKNEHCSKKQKEENKGNLPLTGPEHVILADGCFVIEVFESADDKNPIKWVWNGYNKNIADRDVATPTPRPERISEGKEVRVTYKVMSNPLEATVEVKLRHLNKTPNMTEVHGVIKAHIDGLEAGSVLFKKEWPDNFMSSSERAEEEDLPLARSIVAVPVDSFLQIKGELKFGTYRDPKKLPLDFSFKQGFPSRSVIVGDVEVEINVEWYPNTEEYVVRKGKQAVTGFITKLRKSLADNPDSHDFWKGHQVKLGYHIGSHLLLPRQRAKEPKRWLHIKLQVAGENKSTILVLRSDNLYLKGFMNQNGVWFELSGPTEWSACMLPPAYNSTLLGLDINHGMIGENFTSAAINPSYATFAVRTLSDHPKDYKSYEKAALPHALAIVMVMLRWSTMTSTSYLQVWDTYVKYQGYEIKDMSQWTILSQALLQWRKHDRWPQNEDVKRISHIQNEKDALENVRLVLNYPPVFLNESTTNYAVRPRMELLAISANFELKEGTTITVFDGKRGQIIYKHDEQRIVVPADNKEMRTLALTGPYRGISACGCIQVDIDIPGDDPIVWKWEWDGYKPKREIDQIHRVQVPEEKEDDGSNTSEKHLKGKAKSKATGMHLQNDDKLELTYWVMSNAREATVKVNLRQGVNIQSGQITADIEIKRNGESSLQQGSDLLFSDPPVLLFFSESHVPLSPDIDGNLPLRLARSVVTVPVDSLLRITVDLTFTVHDNQEPKTYKNSGKFDITSRIMNFVVGSDNDNSIGGLSITWYPDQ